MNNHLENSTVEALSNDGASAAIKKPTVHPINDPKVWLKSPMFDHPAHIDIEFAQKQINDVIGITRDKKPIFKLVWNGDRRHWLEYFMEWNSAGQPTAPAFKRPHVRFKAFRDKNKKLIRDVFPPRWLLLARIEPEQYFDVWKHDSYFFAPEINGFKQIRPDEPPADFYLWYATIAKHNDYCCATAEKNGARCYGEYADPNFYLPFLGEQKLACERSGTGSNPFAGLDADDFKYIQEENTGYAEEIAQLEIEQQIYMENPMALLGIVPSMKANVSGKQAEQMVADYFDRQLEETSRLIK